MIEAAELYENFQWANDTEAAERLKDPKFRDKVRMEMADVLYYLTDLANVTGIDLAEAFAEKLAKIKQKYPANIGNNHEEYHRIKQNYRAGRSNP